MRAGRLGRQLRVSVPGIADMLEIAVIRVLILLYLHQVSGLADFTGFIQLIFTGTADRSANKIVFVLYIVLRQTTCHNKTPFSR